MQPFIDIEDYPVEYTLLENSKIVVLSVPYDETSTWGKGADFGPAAILDATQHLEFYDIETDSEVCLNGIYTAEAITEKSSPEAMVMAVHKEVEQYLEQQKFIVTLGGEHSISVGAIMAFAEKFDDLCILQLDAHSDLRQEYKESKFNHACAMARAIEFCPHLIQVGIRSMDASEKPYLVKERLFLAEDIHNDKNWIEKVVKQLKKNVYITIDLDVFDPAIMPSTGTPEPGGLMWYDVIDLMREVNKHSTIVGFDVVELAPNATNKAPDFLAAKLIYKLLTFAFAK